MTWLLLRLVRWWVVRLYPSPPPPVCPDFVEVPEDADDDWLDDPDEITNARWYAEHCYGLPAAVKR